jgi:hypothetical protein
MNDIEASIFNTKFIEIIEGDQDEQIKFLKVYPIFKTKLNLITLWKEQYTKSNNKESMITFLTFALEHDLIDYKMKDIMTILNMLEELKEMTFRDMVKSSIIKGKTNTCIKKISLIDDPYIYDKNTTINIKTMLPYDIAQEWTRIFSSLVDKITCHELIFVAQHDNKYNKNENELITPIEILVSNFHKLSYIVFHTILVEDKNDIDRINTIRHILKICEELKYLGNYHAIFALISSLNNTIIQRLDNLWKTKKPIFTELTELITPCNNYRNYRAILKKNIKNNIVPYIAVIICDIKHVLEYSVYDTQNNNFNSEIYELVLSLLNDFKRIPNNYTLNKNASIYKWFSNINIVYTDTEFYEMSLTLKPNINIHTQLIEKLVEEKDKDISEEKIIPKIKVLYQSDKDNGYDSVEEIIKITEMQQTLKKSRHKSMPPLRTPRQQTNDYISWTIDDVQIWLHKTNMEEYCDKFRDEAIDGLALYNLTNNYLKNDLNIIKLGHRLKILDAIKKI